MQKTAKELLADLGTGKFSFAPLKNKSKPTSWNVSSFDDMVDYMNLRFMSRAKGVRLIQ